MSLSRFGVAVREARGRLQLTLSAMASALGTSTAFLSAMETGRSKVPAEWVEKIASYLKQNGLDIPLHQLKALASESNSNVSLEGLPPHHRMLIAGFANSDLNQEQLEKFGRLLAEIHGEDVQR